MIPKFMRRIIYTYAVSIGRNIRQKHDRAFTVYELGIYNAYQNLVQEDVRIHEEVVEPLFDIMVSKHWLEMLRYKTWAERRANL